MRVDPGRRVMPEWLMAACVLSGQRPPLLAGPDFRMAFIGCRAADGIVETALAHRRATIWAWDHQPVYIEALRRAAGAAGVTNLRLHEQAEPPRAISGQVDLAVVDESIASLDEGVRDCIVALLGASLRPGALLYVRYPVASGWAEVVPLLQFARHTMSSGGHPVQSARRALELLRALRTSRAEFVTTRPGVQAWLDDVLEMSAERFADEFLVGPIVPLSHARIDAALGGIGCEFVGSAVLTDALDLDGSYALQQVVADVPAGVTREVFHDLAVKRQHRHDIYRLGAAPLTLDEWTEYLGAVRIVGEPEVDMWVTDLDVDPTEATRSARRRLEAGCRPVVFTEEM